MSCDKCLYQPICDTYANFGVTDLSATDKTHCKLFKNKADFVEVVRCRNCKHGDVSIISKTKDGQEDIACYCKLKNKVTDIDSYCPSGVRK